MHVWVGKDPAFLMNSDLLENHLLPPHRTSRPAFLPGDPIHIPGVYWFGKFTARAARGNMSTHMRYTCQETNNNNNNNNRDATTHKGPLTKAHHCDSLNIVV